MKKRHPILMKILKIAAISIVAAIIVAVAGAAIIYHRATTNLGAMKAKYGRCYSLYISKGELYSDGLFIDYQKIPDESYYELMEYLNRRIYRFVSISCNDNDKSTLKLADRILREAVHKNVLDAINTNCKLTDKYKIKNYCEQKFVGTCKCGNWQ